MRKAVEQNPERRRSVECSGSTSCIRSSCTSTIEMGWSNLVLQPFHLLADRFFAADCLVANLLRFVWLGDGLCP